MHMPKWYAFWHKFENLLSFFIWDELGRYWTTYDLMVGNFSKIF